MTLLHVLRSSGITKWMLTRNRLHGFWLENVLSLGTFTGEQSVVDMKIVNETIGVLMHHGYKKIATYEQNRSIVYTFGIGDGNDIKIGIHRSKKFGEDGKIEFTPFYVEMYYAFDNDDVMKKNFHDH